MNKAHFGLGYLTDLSGLQGHFLAWIEISHIEFELERENKLKIIILIDENDSLAAIYFKTGGRFGTGSIKIRMQVSSLKGLLLRKATITRCDLSPRFFYIDATILCKFESDKI